MEAVFFEMVRGGNLWRGSLPEQKDRGGWNAWHGQAPHSVPCSRP
jgi:hypothetical protein